MSRQRNEELDHVVGAHDAVEDVALADEVRDEGVLRLVVDVLGRAYLLDTALVHDDYGVAHGEGLLLVVRYIYKSDAELLLDALELVLHVLAQAEVERAERLVEQQYLGPVHERAGDGDALLLAAGELVRLALFKALERHYLQHLRDALLDLLLRHLGDAQAEGDVLEHVQVREQRVLLEHRVDAALVGRDIINPHTVKQHVAARRLEKAADDTQRRRFAAARGPEQCEEFTVVEIDVDRIEDGLAVKIHPAIYQPNKFLRHYPPPQSCRYLESPLSDGTDDYGS